MNPNDAALPGSPDPAETVEAKQAKQIIELIEERSRESMEKQILLFREQLWMTSVSRLLARAGVTDDSFFEVVETLIQSKFTKPEFLGTWPALQDAISDFRSQARKLLKG